MGEYQHQNNVYFRQLNGFFNNRYLTEVTQTRCDQNLLKEQFIKMSNQCNCGSYVTETKSSIHRYKEIIQVLFASIFIHNLLSFSIIV